MLSSVRGDIAGETGQNFSCCSCHGGYVFSYIKAFCDNMIYFMVFFNFEEN